MSTTPETEFDLEKLFLPAWAQEAPNRKQIRFLPGRSAPRGPRLRPAEAAAVGRTPGAKARAAPEAHAPPVPPEPAGPKAAAAIALTSAVRAIGEAPAPRREAPRPCRKIDVTILPDEKGTESLARQIRMTGRAYPLFDIAHLILQKPERQQVRFDVVKKNAAAKSSSRCSFARWTIPSGSPRTRP